ncbi:MAG: alkaline phosphatase family protein [Archangiaceae bacterium]|nr:alkaline phosphatase family protein [Archangiaceae bacterium]
MTLVLTAAFALQAAAAPAAPANKVPRLGVFVVIDQLGSGELEALAIDGDGDFGGLEARGAARFDAWYPYLGTETGPGHATLSTSATPSVHGICANTWYSEGKPTYCVDDPAVQMLGAREGVGRSARFLTAPTLGDTLKTRSPRSKVVSISVKDRAAILLGGPSSDVALWYDHGIGRWTSSRNWGEAVPAWAQRFVDAPRRAFETGRWSPLPATLKRGLDDAREGEDSPDGLGPTFPHDLMSVPPENQHRAYRYTPQSVEDTFALATAALEAEALGTHAAPDLLLVSISATDYSGHAWGPHSVEKTDILERVSVELKKLTAELDKRLGKNGWALVLSSDHGAAPLAESLKGVRVPSGRLLEGQLIQDATVALTPEQKRRFLGLSPPLIFLDLKGLAEKDREPLLETVRKNLAALKGVRRALRTDGAESADNLNARLSTFEGRCGPLFVELQPYVVFTETPHPLGTDHASGNLYDRRVPLYVLGPTVAAGRYATPLDPRDAAPSLAAMLAIPPPDRSEGRPAPAIGPRRAGSP